VGVAFSFLISSLFLEEGGKQRISRPCHSSVVQNIPQYALHRRLDWTKGRCGRYRANISLLLLQGFEGRVVGHSARSEFSTQKGAQATGIVILSTLVLQQYFCNSRTGNCKRTFNIGISEVWCMRKELNWLFWIVSIEVRNLKNDAFLFVICSFKDDVSELHLHVNLKFRWEKFFSSLFNNAGSYRDSIASVVDKWVRHTDWIIPTWDWKKSLFQFQFFQQKSHMKWSGFQPGSPRWQAEKVFFFYLLGLFNEVKKKRICGDKFIRLSLCSL